MNSKIIDTYMSITSSLGHLSLYVQAYVIFNSSNVSGVSFTAFLISFVSMINWLVYGAIKKDKPLVISNIFGVFGSLLVLVGLIRYS